MILVSALIKCSIVPQGSRDRPDRLNKGPTEDAPIQSDDFKDDKCKSHCLH